MISLIMLGAMINFLTRNALGVAAPTLLKDLVIGEKEYSWVTIAFQAALLLQPLSGLVLDRLGLKIGFAIFAMAWSLITMAHGLVEGLAGLIFLRGLLGLAEGCATPAGVKAVSVWFPARERGLAGGVFNIGASVGSMAAAPLVGWAIRHYNWHAAFVITGALGLLWVLAWLAFYDSPARHPALSSEEGNYISTGQETHLKSGGERPSILRLARRRNFWGVALPRFFADPMWGTLTYWMPLYLAKARGWDLKQIALFAWLPFLAADLGCLWSGTLAFWLQNRGIRLINARRWTFTCGACLMTGVAFVGFVPSPAAAIFLLCLGGFAHQTLSITAITMSSDLFKQGEVATVAGMAGTCGNLAVLIFNALIGVYVTHIGYSPFFVAVVVFDYIGAVLLWTLVREPAPTSS